MLEIVKLIFKGFIQLLGIIIWPGVLLVSFWYFRKVVTYLFFSMEEFNFFGAKGRLKNVEVMIEEEATKKIARDQEKEKMKVLREENQKIKDDSNKDSDKADGYLNKSFNLFDKLDELNQQLSGEIEKLREENAKLKKQIMNNQIVQAVDVAVEKGVAEALRDRASVFKSESK